MAKLSFLAGFGAGYVLGARAGRERYEQIRRAYAHAKDDPRLQSIAGMAQARADDVARPRCSAQHGQRRPALSRSGCSPAARRATASAQLLPGHLPRRPGRCGRASSSNTTVHSRAGLTGHPAGDQQHPSPVGQR